MSHKRRRFLGLVGAAFVSGLAGCGGGDTTEQSQPTTTAATTGTSTPTPNAEAEDASGGPTPEATVRQYFESIDAEDWDAANALVARTSSTAYVTEEEQSSVDVTIETIENRSLREAIRDTGDLTGQELDSRVEQEKQNIEDYLAERKYTDHTLVYYSVLTGGDRSSNYLRLVKQGGRWYILSGATYLLQG